MAGQRGSRKEPRVGRSARACSARSARSADAYRSFIFSDGGAVSCLRPNKEAAARHALCHSLAKKATTPMRTCIKRTPSR
eukprot:3862811-Pleurochrysis_carterae.AAC.2